MNGLFDLNSRLMVPTGLKPKNAYIVNQLESMAETFKVTNFRSHDARFAQ